MSAESPDLSSYTVAHLKAELSKIGLSTSGRKQDLVSRLLSHLNSGAKPNGKIFGDFCAKEGDSESGDVQLASSTTPKGTQVEESVKKENPSPGIPAIKTENAKPPHSDTEEKPKGDSVNLEPEAARSTSESEKRIARLKRFGLSSPPNSRETLSAPLSAGVDKLQARAKRFKLHEDQHTLASSITDTDDFDSVKEKYLSMKKRQERWGTTSEEARKAFNDIEEKYKRLERKKKFN